MTPFSPPIEHQTMKTASFSGEDSTVNWGKGWNGSTFQTSGSINSSVTLTIQVE